MKVSLSSALDSASPMAVRPSGTASVLSLLSFAGALAVPTTGRISGVSSVFLIVASVVLLTRALRLLWTSTFVATFIGLLPALAVLGVTADLGGVTRPLPLRLTLAVVWLLSSATLGSAVARRVSGRRATIDVGARVVAVLGGTAFVAGALGRLLLPSRGTDLRLAWMLGEEDNAAFVGVAREVLATGPQGEHLSAEFGTAFMNMPHAILQLFGGPLAGEDDVRLQAITLATLSAVVAIAVSGLAMSILAAFPHHIHSGRTQERSPTTLSIVTGAGAALAGTLAGFSLLAVMPLQAGFLSFLWGLSLVVLATAVVAILPRDASAGARLLVVAHLVSVAFLILGSWPFILTALAPLFLVPVSWIPWKKIRRWALDHKALAQSAGIGMVVAAVSMTWFLLSLPRVRRVTGLGMDVLTIGGTSIHADGLAVRLSTLVVVLLVLLAVLDRSWKTSGFFALTAPVAGVGILMLAIHVATNRLVDGVMAYAGFKLLFGLVTLALVIGSLGLVSASHRFGGLASTAVFALLLVPHVLGGTVTSYDGWWERTERLGSMHAIATVEAIEASTPNVPIRCLPSPGTRIESTTRWAAHFCIRWMEDGFNEGRYDGSRSRFLRAEGDNFSEVIDAVLADFPSEYLFAYRLTMGPGWFGWTG